MNVKTIFSLITVLMLAGGISFTQAQSNDDVYDEGSVWEVSMIRTHANMHDDYLKRLRHTWGKSMMKAKKQGLIKGYKVLSGSFSNDDDYNLLLMIEFENMAVLDSDAAREAKWDAIEEEVKKEMGEMEFDKTVETYGDIREFQGHKLMRELTFKY